MRLHALSYIGDEEDIVEQFVRHTLRHADWLYAVSTKAGPTRDILHRLRQEGLPLTVTNHQAAYHDQHEMLTRLLHRHRHEADWFIPIDADEFIIGDLRHALAAADPHYPSALRWRTYVPLQTDDQLESDILKRIRHRRAAEAPQFTKVVIPSSLIRNGSRIAPGNHAIEQHSWFRKPSSEWGRPLDDVYLGHFPVRSSEQMTKKIRRSWPLILANPKRKTDEGFHWKRMYEQYQDKTLDDAMLTEIALGYSSAETPTTGVIEDPAA